MNKRIAFVILSFIIPFPAIKMSRIKLQFHKKIFYHAFPFLTKSSQKKKRRLTMVTSCIGPFRNYLPIRLFLTYGKWWHPQQNWRPECGTSWIRWPCSWRWRGWNADGCDPSSGLESTLLLVAEPHTTFITSFYFLRWSWAVS